MSVSWQLKSFLSQKYSIYSATELQKKMAIKTGYVVSLPNLCKLINKKPKMIRLETMELICSTLDCALSDFLEVRQKKYKNAGERKKYSYINTPLSKRATKSFPDPKNYL
jgi:DNA-binding Xre family transcriptional regulator